MAETGSELIGVLLAFERALQMATPLEGAIDRFGRLVDRLPGGTQQRRTASVTGGDATTTTGRGSPSDSGPDDTGGGDGTTSTGRGSPSAVGPHDPDG